MPELSATAAPPLPGAAASVPGEGAAAGRPAEPFAATLKQAAQSLAEAATVEPPPVLPDLAALDELTPDAGSLAALLPLLMAIAHPERRDAIAAETSPLPESQAVGEETLGPLSLPAPQAWGAAPAPIRPATPAATDAAMPAAISAALPANAGSPPVADAVGPRGDFDELLSRQTPPGSAENTVLSPTPAQTPAAFRPNAVMQIDTPVGVRGWESEVGNRLVWMAGRQESRAELVLNPPQMGRIEVSLSISADQSASALFVSASPAVREALENALPRLRELMADAGIALGQAQVGSESSGQSARERENSDNFPRALAGDDEAPGRFTGGDRGGVGSWSRFGRAGTGMIDVFA